MEREGAIDDYRSHHARIPDDLAATFARIGIRLKLVTAEWNEYRTRLQAGDAPMALFGWTGDNGDPDNFLGVLLSCAGVGEANRAQWCNEEFTDLINQAMRLGSADAPDW